MDCDASSGGVLDRTLERVGVDPRMYRALVKAYLLIDFRNQQFGRATSTSGPREILTPLFTVTGQNLLIGLFVSVGLFARVDCFFFALVMLCVSMLVTASSVIVEFNEIVLDPDDLTIVGHQPVPVRTYSAARVTNLMAYVLLTIAALNFCPAIVGAGLRDATWTFTLWYSAAALISNLVVAGGIILVYHAVLREHPTTQTRDLLAWVQTGAMLLLGYGAQLVIRDPRQSLQMLAYELPQWVKSTPPGWMAQLAIMTGVEARGLGILVAGMVISGAIWTLVVVRLSASYAMMEPGRSAWSGFLPPLTAPGELGGRLLRWISPPGPERTAWWLCRTFLQRDYNLKMRCWTSMAIVMAAIAMGWMTGKLSDPFLPNSDPVFTLACLYLMTMPLPQIMHNLNFSKDHQASWVLQIAPIANRAAFVGGLRKAVLCHFMVPMLLFLFVVLTTIWRQPIHAAGCTLAAALVVLGVSWAASAVVLKSTPFAAPLARGESFGPIALFASVVGTIAAGVGLLHFFLLKVPYGFFMHLILLSVAVLVTRFFVQRSLSSHTLLSGQRSSGMISGVET